LTQLGLYNSYSRDLNDLREKVQSCTDGLPENMHCPYHGLGRRRVNGIGPYDASLMVVGQGPGPREEESGKPFSGGSGGLLRDILKKVGLEPKEVFLTNLVRCMPPKNKRIISRAIKMCGRWLDDEVGLVHPHLIVCLGNEASEALTGGTARGEVVTTKYGIPAVCMYHTAYLLRVKGKDPARYKEIAEEEYKAWKLVAGIVGVTPIIPTD
jgi:uracil-DNA glycosylase